MLIFFKRISGVEKGTTNVMIYKKKIGQTTFANLEFLNIGKNCEIQKVVFLRLVIQK